MALIVVPNPGQSLANSRPAIAGNFATIDTAFAIDHVGYALADQGKHKQTNYVVSAIDPVIAGTEIAIYNKLSTLSGIDELFIKKGVGTPVEFTSALKASPGWARLPSGILLKWGSSTMAGAGLNTYTFPVAATIPAFTNIFNILVTTAYTNAGDGDAFVRLNSFGAPWTTFTVYGSQRTSVVAKAVSFAYLAIGI